MKPVSKAAVMRVLDAAIRAVQTADSQADEQKFKAAVAAAREKLRRYKNPHNGMSGHDIAKNEVRRYFRDIDDLFDLAVEVALGAYPLSAALKDLRRKR